MADRSSWPSFTYYLYHEIVDYQKALYGMVSQALTEDNQRFIEIPLAVVPVIKIQAAKIRASAEAIIDIFENRPRRTKETHWYKIAREIEEDAAIILLIASDDIEPALDIGQMPIVWAGLGEIEKHLTNIKKAHKRIKAPLIPTTKPISLSIWDEVDEVAEKAFRKVTR